MTRFSRLIASSLCSLFFFGLGCSSSDPPKPPPASIVDSTNDGVITSENVVGVQTEPLGDAPENGGDIMQYVMTNANGMKVTLINIGAGVTAIEVPDKEGDIENVALGFANWEDYLTNSPYFGCICGRYANRIAKGKFSLSGTEYSLAVNNDPNHLHGGVNNFSRKIWSGTVSEKEPLKVKFDLTSDDGDEGYPGRMHVSVTYQLTNDDELKISYTATSDKPTIVNLTNHTYFNLAGVDGSDESVSDTSTVLDHQLELNCDRYLPVDETSIPLGEIVTVKGTPMDFTSPHTIGERIDEVPGGYDHCYVINETNTNESTKLQHVGRVVHLVSGRVMEIETTEPGVQLYTGNFLDGSDATAGFVKHAGFCLECQHFPEPVGVSNDGAAARRSLHANDDLSVFGS
ncbi:MAG: galactose mutarotase [Planctomycetota bacterium]|nr:galactose mutarotase [Planctomycetota bacterium]